MKDRTGAEMKAQKIIMNEIKTWFGNVKRNCREEIAEENFTMESLWKIKMRSIEKNIATMAF